MKKILISKQSLAKTYSGACRSVHEEIKYFKSCGYEVHTISEDPNVSDIKASGAISHKSVKRPWHKRFNRRMQFSKQTAQLAKKLDADLVIGHGDYQNPDIHFIHNCVHLASEKIHGKVLSESDEMYKTHTPIFKNHQFKHLIANSKLVKSELISRFSIPDKDISVIYPAVDESQFRVLSKQVRDNKRAVLGVEADEFLVGLITSGNFKKRGVDRFFRAINLLPAKIANKCHFVFVGKDTLPDEFQEILDSGPYKDRVKLLPLIDNVEDYFNALDIFVLPARIEEFGRVVAEAMACGAPVITTNWVGASELMEGKSENFIYSGENDHELAQLMNSLLSDDELRVEISALNAKSASAVFESKLPEQFEKIIVPFIK